MEECFICEVKEDKVRLFDAIFSNGLRKICVKCAGDEQVPLIKKPTTLQLRESESKKRSFHEAARSILEEKRVRDIKEIEKQKQNVTLKDIIDKNLDKKYSAKEEKGPRMELIPNFHWIVMRARRKKHLNQKELAEAIREAEITIKMIEKGVLPEDEYRIVNKLENYLGIRISESDESEKKPTQALSFDPLEMQDLTISDLHELKKTRKS